MSFGKLIQFEKQGNIGVVIFDNEKKLNTINEAFYDEMEAIQNEIKKDLELRAIAILANGANFSAGYDIGFLSTTSSEKAKNLLPRFQEIYNFWQKIHLPVVVGVQGVCFGSATEIILSCDIRIVSEDARLAIIEAKYGLAPDIGGTARLTKLVGIGQAKRLIMACDEVDAKEAYSIGLAEVVVPNDQLREKTLGYAKKMAALSPNAMRFAKKGINLAQESSISASLLFEEAQSVYCCGTEDLREATTAFFEKRKPVFTGK